MNKLFALVGESCSGKDTILKFILEKYPIEVLVSNTTRPKRPNETNGVEYNFVDKSTFKQHHNNNDLLEYSSFTVSSGETWFYYTLKDSLKLESRDQIKIVDTVGLSQLRPQLKNQIVVIYITCSEDIRRERYLLRCKSQDKFEDRLKRDREAFRYLKYDYKVINDGSKTIDELADDIISIIKSEKNN